MVYFDRPIANRLLGTYHFVCLDIIREEKAGQPEKQMNKQKHDSDRGRSLVFEISEKMPISLKTLKALLSFGRILRVRYLMSRQKVRIPMKENRKMAVKVKPT